MKSRRPIKQSNTDTLFKLPVPIPEPPRMVNIKPSVPDLSIDCDLTTRASPKDDYKDLQTDLHFYFKRQDEKLDRLSKQLQLLLSIHAKKEPEKRSVGTMTHFHSKSAQREKSSSQRKFTERLKQKKASDSGLLTSESESRSDRSELRTRAKTKEDLYEKYLRNIDNSTDNQRLSNSRSEQSESHSSPSPPRNDRNPPTPSKAVFEENMITKLAEKYLKLDKPDVKSSRQTVPKKLSQPEGEEHNLRRGKRTSRRKPTSDFTEEASIGVVNYFEKYGLLDDD